MTDQAIPPWNPTTIDLENARALGAQPSTRIMYDTSNPAGLNVGAQVAAGYLGGSTPHVWTRADWDAQQARWRLPIWVPENPTSGQAEGAEAAAAAQRLGVPRGTVIGWDLETHQWAGEVGAAEAMLRLAGYSLMPYGSISTLFSNPAAAGWWVADWTGQPHLFPHPMVVATQYDHDIPLSNGVRVDQSLIIGSVPLWDARPPAPAITALELVHLAADDLTAAGERLRAITALR